MKQAKFADILAQFLEEKEEGASPTPQPSSPQFTTSYDFSWQAPHSMGMRGRSAYSASREPVSPMRLVPTTPPPAPVKKAEPVWTLALLNSEEMDAWNDLKSMGAVEFGGSQTISRSLLKRAHRRLAKALHPDTIAPSLSESARTRKQEQFLRLQGAYETLSAKLKKLASESASDSESASAAGSQRPDAA